MFKNSAAMCNGTSGYASGIATVEFAKSIAGLPKAFFGTVALWQKRAQDRQHLRALDSHLLTDMGLTRASAQLESSKPFWRS